MKKILYSVMALAIAAMTFTACEDVPQPYPTPVPDNNGSSTEVEGATGDGSLENPFNSIAAINEAKKLGSGGVSEQYYYIKGKVVSIATDKNDNVLNFNQGTYGNASFYISDDGTSTNQFYCYRVLYLGNKKWTSGSGDILKVGDEVVVCARITMYNTTPETQQNEGYLYSLNGKTDGGGSEETDVATGDGTLENPFNSVAATNEAKKLSSGAVSDKAYYIKGKVVSIATDKNGNVLNFDQGTFGNATFYISDDGTESGQFYCYRVLYLGNKKWTSGAGDILKVGDEVIVCAKLTMYNTTPETQQNEGYLYSLNGKTEADDGGNTPQPSGDVGSIDAPKTVADALAAINALEEGATTDAYYYVKGKVVSIATKVEDIGPNSSSGKKYKDINYYISDDGSESNTVYVYRGKNLNNSDFTSADQLKVNDEVVVYGKLQKYKNTNTNEIVPEMAQGNYLVKTSNTSEGGEQGGGEQGGTTVTSLTNGDFETWADGLPTGWKSTSSASSATLTQSTDAHGGSYSVNVNGKESGNVRLATQEITLAAGSYNFSFWVKATTTDKAQVRPGYAIVVNGSINSSSGYKYGNYADISTSWTQVSYDFTLDSETTVCLLVMNPKKSDYSSGKDVLVDDAMLTKK